jgi:hypothetical protein
MKHFLTLRLVTLLGLALSGAVLAQQLSQESQPSGQSRGMRMDQGMMRDMGTMMEAMSSMMKQMSEMMKQQ